MIDTSCRVRYEDFETEWFGHRVKDLHENYQVHRKLWEFCIIAQVFLEKCDFAVGPPIKALGFGVGKEPLANFFATHGADVLATDQDASTAGKWLKTNQHVGDTGSSSFTYRSVDMNNIPDDLLQGKFDFTWSAGSFEHLGSIQHGIKFFCQQMKCLKPGGIAAHTTEFNFADNDWTLESPDMSLYRRRDLEALRNYVMAGGDKLLPLDLRPGIHEADRYVDKPPYEKGKYHLSLRVENIFASTSILLIGVKS